MGNEGPLKLKPVVWRGERLHRIPAVACIAWLKTPSARAVRGKLAEVLKGRLFESRDVSAWRVTALPRQAFLGRIQAGLRGRVFFEYFLFSVKKKVFRPPGETGSNQLRAADPIKERVSVTPAATLFLIFKINISNSHNPYFNCY